MCGIVGKFNLGKNRRYLDKNSVIDLGKAMDVQRHRGPDDSGVCGISDGRVYEGNTADDFLRMNQSFEGLFGFNRLSIRDLSINGHQPMISEDGKVILLFNGEIYNDADLRNLVRGGIALEDIQIQKQF